MLSTIFPNLFRIVARFNKYRIPRENMLMRFSKVSKDGVYTKPPHAKVKPRLTIEAEGTNLCIMLINYFFTMVQ